MRAIIRDNDIARGFEVQVFHYGVIVALFARLIRSIHELLIDSPLPVLILGLFNLLVFIFLLRIHRKYYRLARIILYSQILITSILTWNNAGGWNGAIPYIILVVIIAVIITSHGVLQVVILLAYCAVLTLFSQSTFLSSFSSPNQNYSLLSSEFDFLAMTLILILITIYLKNRFFAFRDSVERTNARLKESAETLGVQTQKLHDQQAELNAIRNRLESTATSKVNEVKFKAEILDEYAFVNAHHVRGSLARVLGLIHLIEIETPHHPKSEMFHIMKNQAEEMDTIIRKINEITS